MDLITPLFLTILFFSPLIIAIVYFIKIIVKSLSVFNFQLLLADIFILLWCAAGVPVLIHQDYFLPTELIIIEELGVIFGALSLLFLNLVFNQPYYGNKQLFFAQTGVVAFGLIAGAKLALILINNPNNSIYGLYISNGKLLRYTSPVISFLILLGFCFLVILIFMFSLWQNKFPNYLISTRIKTTSFYAAALLFIGASLNYFGILLPISFLGISNTLFFSSRFFLSFAFILITVMITQNPIITLKEKGNPNYLIENGVVGWILVANTDQGPEIKIISDNSKKLYSLDERTLMLYAVSSISIVGIGQTFADTQFIIPFPTKEKELSVICYSFNMNDPTLKDPRRKNRADLVYGMIIPRVFLNYLGNIGLDSFSLTKKVITYQTMSDLMSEIDLAKETKLTFRNLLSNKII